MSERPERFLCSGVDCDRCGALGDFRHKMMWGGHGQRNRLQNAQKGPEERCSSWSHLGWPAEMTGLGTVKLSLGTLRVPGGRNLMEKLDCLSY